MLKEQIIAIIKSYYPKCFGAILTGSQKDAEVFTPVKDIDLVIFDSQFSVVSSISIIHKGFRIDVTQVPGLKLDIVLIDESLDPRGILLNMITNGEVVFDTQYKLIAIIQEDCKRMFNRKHLNSSINKKIEAQLTEIKRLQKELKNLKDADELFFTFNEIFRLVTDFEVRKHSGWIVYGLRKHQLLNENASAFLNEILEMSKIIIKARSQHGDFKEAVNQLDTYLQYFLTNQTIEKGMDNNLPKYIILDLSYSNISVSHFINVVLLHLDNDILLKEHYDFFFLSDRTNHRLFKNYLSVVFKTSEKVSTELIFRKFQTLLKSIHLQGITISLSANNIFSMDSQLKDDILKSGVLANAIQSDMIKEVRSGKDLNEEDIFKKGVSTLAFVASVLDMNLADVLTCNFILFQKDLLDKNEQLRCKTVNVQMQSTIKNIAAATQYYKQHQEILINCFWMGLDFKKARKSDNENLALIIEPLEDIILIYRQSLILLTERNSFLKVILEKQYHVVDIDLCMVYTLTVEFVTRLLNFTQVQKSLIAFVTSEIIKEFQHNPGRKTG